MPKIYLLRHLRSQWNLENRFTGWVDVPLSKGVDREAKKLAEKISKLKIDLVFSSPLARNQGSVLKIWEYIDKQYPLFLHFKGKMKEWSHFQDISGNHLPVYISEKLNERYYGKLQGKNKAKTIKKHGFEKVRGWRRAFNQGPPGGERLKDTYNRTVPFYKKHIQKQLKKGRVVLVVASHNSLRALVKHIEKIPDEDIINREIPVGTLIEYQFNKSLELKKKKIL
jgi:2,3-bisphosphoglycerate-dependent phosphoglycerate mutase